MQKKDLKKIVLPDSPGVYFFRNAKSNILYVGKASSLRDRVRSYFSNDLIATRGPRLVDMVAQAESVAFEVTDSVLEALILEAHYIKKYQPKANTDGKDDKSFNYVGITKEKYPRLLLIRGKELPTNAIPFQALYGPFPHSGQLKEALRLIRKIFPFFDTKKPIEDIKNRHDRGKVQFNQQIGLYPSISDTEAQKQYAKTIYHLKLFFAGRKKALMKQLEKEMNGYAKNEQFELASESKRRLFALQHIQDVSLLKHTQMSSKLKGHTRIEAYDIAHTKGSAMVGVMTVVENSEVAKREYRKFTVRSVNRANDTAALTEVLSRRFGHNEWEYPTLIVVDGGKAQINSAEKVLKEYGIQIPVVSVVKDEKHRPREILGLKRYRETHERDIVLANQEAHRFALSWHRAKRGKVG